MWEPGCNPDWRFVMANEWYASELISNSHDNSHDNFLSKALEIGTQNRFKETFWIHNKIRH